jgi:RND family efflux transporter MFP subunit
VGNVRVDQPCEIQLDALPDRRFRGTVSRMVPTVDRAKATVTVKVRFLDKDERVLPEMSAKVSFLTQEVPPDRRDPRTVVTPAAVVDRDGRTIVYRIDGERASETTVETGGKLGDAIEIARGLEPGDKVVVRPPQALRDGMAVRPAEARR